jgi:hypothetical protein
MSFIFAEKVLNFEQQTKNTQMFAMDEEMFSVVSVKENILL